MGDGNQPKKSSKTRNLRINYLRILVTFASTYNDRHQRRTNIAKKPSKKNKSQGCKPKGTVSPNDTSCDAIYLKIGQDSYQQVLGNVNVSRNIPKEYKNAISNLRPSTWGHDAYHLLFLQRFQDKTTQQEDRVIVVNLLTNQVPSDRLRSHYAFNKHLQDLLKRPRQLRCPP